MAPENKTIVATHLQLTKNTGECQRLHDFLDKSLAELPVTEAFKHDLRLAAEELLANIIEHGYDSNSEASVDIDLTADERHVQLAFTDSGKAFNPLEHDSQQTRGDRSEGGMGLLLVKSLTDEQTYARADGHNVFVIAKHYNT